MVGFPKFTHKQKAIGRGSENSPESAGDTSLLKRRKKSRKGVLIRGCHEGCYTRTLDGLSSTWWFN